MRKKSVTVFDVTLEPIFWFLWILFNGPIILFAILVLVLVVALIFGAVKLIEQARFTQSNMRAIKKIRRNLKKNQESVDLPDWEK